MAIKPEHQNLSVKQQIGAIEEMHAFRARLQGLESGREEHLSPDGRDETQAKIAGLRETVAYLEELVSTFSRQETN